MNQLLDLLPVAIFVAAYFLFDIYVATAALMVAVSVQVAALALLKKPISRELKFTLVASLVFGALTLFFRNELFIQWKPTIVNWLLAATLIGTHLLGRRNLLKQLLGKQLTLVDDVWTRLNFGWACGFFIAGALNLVVAYGFSMEVWVSYKLIGGFALTFLYVMLTMVYLSRKGLLNSSGAAPARADGGRPATVPDHAAGSNEGTEVEKEILIAPGYGPWPLLALLLLLGAGAATHAQTAWVSDVLTVPVRSGPSNGHRIVHRGIPSGTRFEILDRDADSGYVQIRTSGGTEGWILEQYAVREPIARDRLGAATREVERLNGTVQELRNRLETVQQDKGSAEQASETLEAQVSALQIELADLKRVSAGALEIDANNTRLTELNARLRDELDMLGAELDQLRDNTQQRWLMIGGGLVLLGLLLGLSVKSRPRRSAWS